MFKSLSKIVSLRLKRCFFLQITILAPVFIILIAPINAESFNFPKTQIHRGFWLKGLQENTLEAFRAAKNAKQTMIELDVQFSKDKQVVVFHDFDLKRLFGTNDTVNSLTAEELKIKAKVPTLNEVLADPQVPKLVNIEIKHSNQGELDLEKAVKDVIEKNQAQDRVIISSFNEEALTRCATLMPNITRALLINKADSEDNLVFMQKLNTKAEVTQTKLIHLNYSALTEPLIKLLIANHYSFSAWTLDDETLATQLLKAGSLSIITNRVDMKLAY
jgi:glycerophosphoryl diester phosphodiesterase